VPRACCCTPMLVLAGSRPAGVQVRKYRGSGWANRKMELECSKGSVIHRTDEGSVTQGTMG